MRKMVLYIKLNILYMFRNSARMILTVIGISVGLLVYVMGNTVVDSYLNTLYNEAYSFDVKSFWLYDDDEVMINKLKAMDCNLNLYKCNFSGDAYATFGDDYMYDGIQINNIANLIGLNYSVSDASIPYVGKNEVMLTRAHILWGTDFECLDGFELDKCAIIEKSTAIYLFQKENAVGEYIDVITPYGYSRLEVIGIIEDLPSSKSNNMAFNQMIKQKRYTEMNNTLNIYMTYDCLQKMMDGEVLQNRFVVDFDEAKLHEVDELVSEINNIAGTYNIDSVAVSRDTMIQDIQELEKSLRLFLNLIITAMLLVSSVMIATVYFFSVKERACEIGIRRALGASEFDIASQFVIEGIVIASFSAIVTLFVSLQICNIISFLFINVWYEDIRMIIDIRVLASMYGIAFLEGVLSSLCPALLAAKARPAEAIRWD